MPNNYRKIFKTLGILVIVALLLYIGGNYLISRKIEKTLQEKLPENVSLTYKDTHFNIFSGSYSLDQPKISIDPQTDTLSGSTLEFSKIDFQNLSYTKFLFKDDIQLSKILLSDPNIQYNTQTQFPKNGGSQKPPAILVKSLEVTNGTLQLSKGKNQELLHAKNLQLSITEIQNSEGNLPIQFAEVQLQGDSLRVPVSKFDVLTMGSIDFHTSSNSTLQQVALKTTLSKEALSDSISTERDHYRIEISEITFQDFQFLKDSTLGYAAQQLTLSEPNIEIFRDKRVPDTYRTKPLMNEMLRKLPFPLKIDSVMVHKGRIIYEELIRSGMPPGKVDFTALEGTIQNLGNTYPKNTSTHITVDAQILKDTPFKAEWDFDVANLNNQFEFSAQVAHFGADELNSFTIPSDKLKLSGEMYETYFCIYGNEDQSHVDMKVNYKGLQVTLLKDDLTEKKGFLSAIANIFVNKESTDTEGNFRKASTDVKRVKRKSNFNYIWINILAGLKKSVM